MLRIAHSWCTLTKKNGIEILFTISENLYVRVESIKKRNFILVLSLEHLSTLVVLSSFSLCLEFECCFSSFFSSCCIIVATIRYDIYGSIQTKIHGDFLFPDFCLHSIWWRWFIFTTFEKKKRFFFLSLWTYTISFIISGVIFCCCWSFSFRKISF